MDMSSWGFEAGATVVITGAASGIGQATARRCAELGLGVGVWDIDGEAARRMAAELHDGGARAYAVEVDVNDGPAVAEGFAATVDALGPVRHLVNNAGPRAADARPFAEGLATAAGSMQLVSEAFLALEPAPGASIVNVSSVVGNIVAGEPLWYCSAKAAIAGYTRALAALVGRTVRVNAVAPSLVDTPRMTKWTESEVGARWAETNPLGRWAIADEVAVAIVFLLSPLAAYVNGVLLPVDGGQTLVL
jgi:NAD(P)-dependent dehydrogenase (short-subunit alcohol dehydrogenase family)